MSKKLIALVAVFAALAVGAASPSRPSSKAGGRCQAGAECCYEGSPCCEGGCCYEGSPCCFPGSPCCEGAGDCCHDGSPCCAAVAVSADAPKPAAKADAPAAKPAANATVIAVEDMDCPSCAKKIVARISAVAGVAKAVADTEASKLVVTPKDKVALSAKALWQAVVSAGYKPTRLEGPAGTFTALPKE